ncbi:MAG: ABC transporter ATP-binding protein/permease [Alphaproteobacteria bacterium]|nr:ABC transporter ATP-binding protein/permease [Alphaproteobacteria bacterium]
MQKTSLKFVCDYLKNFKYVLTLIVSLMIISQSFSQTGEYYMAKVFDFAASNKISDEYWYGLLWLLVLFIGLDAVGQVFQTSAMWFNGRLIPHIRSIVIKDVFEYVNKHSISYFTNEMTGNISNKFNQLQNGVVEFMMMSTNILFDFCYLTVNLIILGWMSRYWIPAVALWIGIAVLIGHYFGKKRASLSKATSTQQSKSNAAIIDSIANYAEVKSFANYRYEKINLLKILHHWRHAETMEQKQKVLINFYLGITTVCSLIFFVSISVILLYFKQMELTGFFFVLTIFNRLSGLSFSVNWTVNNMSRIVGQIDSALETLSIEPEILDSPQAKILKAKDITVRFENVSFGYNEKQQIFNNFNLDIKAGEKVGIVGVSGSGKSTLIKLIARYFDVTGGHVKMNGIDIKDVTQESLHKHIAIIPQDVCLFNRTLAENIRYGKTDASLKEIKQAAKAASADKFIERFPNQYNTKVGDRGVILSGGERQRIAIARAVLKNAPVLIFDEATSSLDSESERYIKESLKILMKNKTVVAIAHRLSTLREMDRIIVLEQGKIIEQGTHLSLLRKKGRYAKLFKLQSDGYLGKTD